MGGLCSTDRSTQEDAVARVINQLETDLNSIKLLALTQPYLGPFWVYDAEIIRQQIAKLAEFDVIRFAQKSCSNTHILRLMRAEGVLVDSVSVGEVKRALAAGFRAGNAEIVYTADLLDYESLAVVTAYGLTVNAGSIDMLEQLGQIAVGHPVWLRINPGFGHGHSQKTNTGGENSKHGIWHQQLSAAVAVIKKYRLNLHGLHMHIGSGVDYPHLARVCEAMVQQVKLLDMDIKAISAGGGLSIPYQLAGEQIDTEHYFHLWDNARAEIAKYLGHSVQLEIEPGRFLVAEAGVLICQVRALKMVGRRYFVLTDVGFNDLQRPAMYGSYHHISVLPADGRQVDYQVLRETIIAGPLCESGDVFTQNEQGDVESRWLPEIAIGDFLVFHDTGAYGASMSSNYNSRPLLAEYLYDKGQARQIRRRQTIDELLALESFD